MGRSGYSCWCEREARKTAVEPAVAADAGLHGFARLLVSVYFAIVNGRTSRRG